MFDRSMPGSGKLFAVVAGACVLVGGSPSAHAQPSPEKTVDDRAPRATPATSTPPAPPVAAPSSEPVAAQAPGNVPAQASDATEEDETSSWFYRAPLTVAVGQGTRKWAATFYGFVETDFIVDSTRSYQDSIGNSLVARSDTYAGQVGRTQFSIRNTRVGMALESPVIGGVKPSAVIEADFFGGPSASSTSEATSFASPTLRLRQAYVKLQNDVIDVVVGQTYDVFGWQGYYYPCSLEFLGLPNQLFSRSAQFRLSHAFNAQGAVSVDLAASAARPAQQDSMVPDAEGGLRFNVNRWKGISTPGNTGTAALPLSIGVSGVLRQFKVNAFAPPPVQSSNQVSGWGLSVDALIPVIPASSARDRGNRLTLTGSFVTGTGIGDLITATGGATFPTLPNPAQGNPAPQYTGNIDNGLVSFDTRGVLHTIDWQAFKVGLQYYLPPSGRVIFSANYTQARSNNMASLFPKGGAEIELLGAVASLSQYADLNLFFDATPAVRFGISGQYTRVEYLDGNKPHNYRAMAQALYAF